MKIIEPARWVDHRDKICVDTTDTDPKVATTLAEIHKLSEEGARCPECGDGLLPGFGMLGGGYGPYVVCNASECGFLRKHDLGPEAELKTTFVVSGVAIRNGLVLMGKRKSGAGRIRPGLWEFPGGKINAGETPWGALTREWKEELGIDIIGPPDLGISTFTMALEILLQVDLYEVKFDSKSFEEIAIFRDFALPGHETLPDHDMIMWVHPLAAVRFLPCSPGFYLHYADLRNHMMETKRWTDVPQ